MDNKTFLIPLVNWESFVEKIESLSARATKVGAEAIGYRVLGPKKEKRNIHGDIVQHEGFEVEVFGPAPRFQGWEFMATIEHTEHGNIIRSIKILPEIYQSVHSNCDHCKSFRKRKDTFVLRHEDGTYMQVGRSCLKDFLGKIDPEHIALFESWVREINEPLEERDARDKHFLFLETFIPWIVMHVQIHGYAGKNNKFDRVPTGDAALITMRLSDEERTSFPPTEEHHRIAREAIVWNQAKTGDQFANSTALVFKKEVISFRDFGFLAFGVFDYIKHIGALPEREVQKPTEWISKVGERIELKNLKLIKKIQLESNYQYAEFFVIYNLQDESGNIFVWKTSNASAIDEGSTVDVKFTIKAHSEYKGRRQNEVTRLKVLKVHQEEESQSETEKKDL